MLQAFRDWLCENSCISQIFYALPIIYRTTLYHLPFILYHADKIVQGLKPNSDSEEKFEAYLLDMIQTLQRCGGSAGSDGERSRHLFPSRPLPCSMQQHPKRIATRRLASDQLTNRSEKWRSSGVSRRKHQECQEPLLNPNFSVLVHTKPLAFFYHSSLHKYLI